MYVARSYSVFVLIPKCVCMYVMSMNKYVKELFLPKSTSCLGGKSRSARRYLRKSSNVHQ